MTLESAQETAERLAKEAEGGLRVGSHGHVKPASSSVLLALAEYCEKEAPSRELDEAIALALGWNWVGLSPRYWLEPGMDVSAFQRTPDTLDPRAHLAYPSRFTTSLDSAVTLVPETHEGPDFWTVSKGNVDPKKAYARIAGYSFPGVWAATPALALCAAALRARAAMAEDAPRGPQTFKEDRIK